MAVFEIGEVLAAIMNINLDDLGIMGNEDLVALRQTLHFYHSKSGERRRQCVAWVLSAKQSKFQKDVRAMVAKRLWSTRCEVF